MLNLTVEKGASKDRDRSGSSITRPRTGLPTGFLQISRLDFGLGTSPYTVDIYFIFFLYFFFLFIFFFYCSSFDVISTCISHSHPRRAFIYCYHHLFSHLSIILSLFASLLIKLSHLFSNFYLNSKINTKLSLILTSTYSIPTHTSSSAIIFSLNTKPHYFSSLWIQPLLTLY